MGPKRIYGASSTGLATRAASRNDISRGNGLGRRTNSNAKVSPILVVRLPDIASTRTVVKRSDVQSGDCPTRHVRPAFRDFPGGPRLTYI